MQTLLNILLGISFILIAILSINLYFKKRKKKELERKINAGDEK